MRHSGPNTSKGQVICDKRPCADRISQLWVALLGAIVIWRSRLSGSLQSAITGRIRKRCSASFWGEKWKGGMNENEAKKKDKKKVMLEFFFSPKSRLSWFWKNSHSHTLWRFVEFPLYFIKMYMNKLQQRTTLKKTSKRAAITGVNNWTHTRPSPRPTPLTPPVQWDKDMPMMSHI